jgi:hypothetical protein
MTTIPRHCLICFADYKQKGLAVNGKINFRSELFAQTLPGLHETTIYSFPEAYGTYRNRYCLFIKRIPFH